MARLICMRGYSGSGKSTRAAEIAKENDAVIVSRDQLRKMLLNDWWTGDKKDEDRVTVAEEAQVRAFLKDGVNVVVDSTHLNPPYLRKWARLASRMGADFAIVDVIEDVEECKKRAYLRWAKEAGPDGTGDARYLDPKVIDQQVKRWPVKRWPTIKADPPFVVEPVEVDESLRKAIIVDIDGTLAHIPEGGRSPYDYSRVHEDIVDPIIRSLVGRYHDDGYAVLAVSGRDDSCWHETRKWLLGNRVKFHHLIMRPTDAVDVHGGKLPDFVVKYNLFNEHIRGKYNVRLVLDDRRQVVDTWRALGLKVLDVAGNEF